MGYVRKQDQYNKIWKQIEDYISNNGYTDLISKGLELVDGHYYGENMFSNDDYLEIYPIERIGRNVYGVVSIDINYCCSSWIYRTFEEFVTIMKEHYFPEILHERS